MRRLFPLAAALLIVLSLLIAPAQADSGTLLVDAHRVTYEVAPYYSHAKLMVPLRSIVEAAGDQVTWDSDLDAAIVQSGTTSLVFLVDMPLVLQNGEPVNLPAPNAIRSGRVMVPASFLAQLYGQIAYQPAAPKPPGNGMSESGGPSAPSPQFLRDQSVLMNPARFTTAQHIDVPNADGTRNITNSTITGSTAQNDVLEEKWSYINGVPTPRKSADALRDGQVYTLALNGKWQLERKNPALVLARISLANAAFDLLKVGTNLQLGDKQEACQEVTYSVDPAKAEAQLKSGLTQVTSWRAITGTACIEPTAPYRIWYSNLIIRATVSTGDLYFEQKYTLKGPGTSPIVWP